MSRFGARDGQIEGQSDRKVGLPSFFSRSFSCRTVAIFLAGFWASLVSGDAAARTADEFRGLWVVRHTLTSPQQIRKAVDRARRAHFNALLVQVRGRGDAYYHSRLVPGSEDLPDNPAFDPLALVIREAHRAGLEVHAWVNVYLTWHPTDRRPQSSDHVLLRHPEWFMTSDDGIDMGRMDLGGVNLVKRGVEGRYLSPGIPEVRAHLLRVVEEIVRNYDIDGLHLDYVRYPNVHYDYNLISRAEFVRHYRFDPLDLRNGGGEDPRGSNRWKRMEKVWQRWRTDRVSVQVQEIRRLLMRLKPWVKLSAAVKPDFEVAYYQYGQDWIGWINKQMVDFVVPMFYVGSTEEIGIQIKNARKYVKKGHLYAGVGAYNQRPSDTIAQVEQARRLGLKGVALYSYDSLIEQPETVDRLQKRAFRLPARIPGMGWKQERYDGKAEAR